MNRPFPGQPFHYSAARCAKEGIMASRIEELGKQYGLVLALLVTCVLWMLPTSETMNLVQHKLLVVFAGMVVL